MTYGLPYQGSKSRIAKWVIDNLPDGDTFVDLFAGGCAVTHAALLSGKYKHFIANDIGDGPQIFVDAIKGEFEGFSMVASREEFKNTDDPVLKILYSFGTDQRTYAFSPKIEPVKVTAQRMLSAPSMHERRYWYRKFIKELGAYLDGGEKPTGKDGMQGLLCLQGLVSLERLESLERLGRLGKDALQIRRGTYQSVEIPEGAIVYCDPPYKNVKSSKRYAGKEFDYAAFERWLAYVPFPVYVSEFDCPEGCTEIAHTERQTSMAATTTSTCVEHLFVQSRFLDTYLNYSN